MKTRIISAVLGVLLSFTPMSVMAEPVQDESTPLITSASPDDVPELSFSFSDPLPTEYADYFENLLENPSADDKYNVKPASISYVFGKYQFGSSWGLSSHDKFGHNKIRNSKRILAIRDTESNNIIAINTYEWDENNATAFTSILSDLPDFFDIEKHEFVFFYYVIEYYSGDDYTDPSPVYFAGKPVAINLRDHIFGDADKNGVVNLNDVTIILKHIADWSNVEIEYPPYDGANGCSPYVIQNVTTILKIIAGWGIESFELEHSDYGFERYASLRYYYTN